MVKSTRFFSIVLCFFFITCEVAPSKVVKSEESSIAIASKASNNGEWLKAAQLFEQLYLQELSNEELNYQTGTNYLRANKPRKALAILSNFDNKHQDSTNEFNGRQARIAKAYYKIRDFQKVEEVVRNYTYPKMYRGLAREHLKALIQLNKKTDLAAHFSNYQEKGIYDDKGKKTNTGFLYRAICNELLLVDNKELLSAYATKYQHWVKEHRPKDKRNLAIAIFYQQDYLQAISRLKDALAVEDSPRHRMELAGLLGVCYAKNRELGKAKTQIQKIHEMEDLPARHDAFGAKYYHQARIEVALGQQEKAIYSLQKAIANKAAFWSNRFNEDGLMKELFDVIDFEKLIAK